MRKDHFTDEALAQARALAGLKYSEDLEDQRAFSEAYNFAACQRPDGSIYPIAGGKQCRKGSPAGNLQKEVNKAAEKDRGSFLSNLFGNTAKDAIANSPAMRKKAKEADAQAIEKIKKIKSGDREQLKIVSERPGAGKLEPGERRRLIQDLRRYRSELKETKSDIRRETAKTMIRDVVKKLAQPDEY